MFAAEIRKGRAVRMLGFSQWRWHLDEVFVKINGKPCYLGVRSMLIDTRKSHCVKNSIRGALVKSSAC